jgi:glycosyltransferase involved in cell wall biosynthesis
MKADITFGIVGRVNESLFDGQTVKTRTLTDALRRFYPNCSILVAESSLCKRNPIRLVIQLWSCVRKADVIFVLLSRNGLRILLPMLFFLNRFYKKPVIHDCVGGAHDQTLLRYPELKQYYEKMSVNWVETQSLKQKLEAQGLTNVAILPNFKNIRAIPAGAVERKAAPPFRFCTFSRVNEAKGIGRAAEAVLAINRQSGSQLVQLDVYGPVEDNFDIVLNDYIGRSGGAITYCGVADPDESVDILKQYYGLLFPTTYFGEGFPGTLIDAFSSGLPVIATDWHCNGEIITHGKTGFLYPPEQPEQLKTWIEYAVTNPDQFYAMGVSCLEDVAQYSVETAMKTVNAEIEKVLQKTI